MADSYVCSGATMKCTMGTSTARLTVLPIRTVYLTGQPMANISDHLTMVNLAPFGRCRSLGFPATAAATAAHHGHLTPMPCMHNTPFPWMNGKNDYIVKGDPALLKSSTCQCMWGGTISLVTDGQVGEGTQWIPKKTKTHFHVPDFGLTQYQVASTQGAHRVDNHSAPPPAKIDLLFQAISKLNKDNDNDKAEIITKQKRINAVKNAQKGKKNDAKNSNGLKSNLSLHYGKAKDQANFKNNCGTTSNTFLLRMLGYEVTARGVTDTLSNVLLSENAFRLWTNDRSRIKAFKNISMIRLWNQMGKNNANKVALYKTFLNDACKEEGYYLMTLSWNDRAVDERGVVIKPNTRHATIIKSSRDEKGNIILTHIEPQNPLHKETNIDKFLNRLAPLNEMPYLNSTVQGSGRPGIGDGVMRVLDKDGKLVEGLNVNEDLLDAFMVVNQ